MTEDIKSRLIAAKLSLNDIFQPAQLIKFENTCNEDELLLVEFDPTVLESLDPDNSLIIRGHEDDTAVLCTEDATYDLKEVKTSNSIILLENVEVSTENLVSNQNQLEVVERKAICSKSSYIELKRKIPDLSRLRQLVEESPFKGKENEDEYVGRKFYDMNDFLELIPASKIEIENYLREITACCIDGKYRILDFDYVVECLGIILQVIDMESLNFDDVELNELSSKVNDSGELVPQPIIFHLLITYGYCSDMTDDEVHFTLSQSKLSKFFAENLLKAANKFDFEEFMSIWKESLPKELDTNEDYLLGLAIIDKKNRPSTIRRFSSKDLPLNAAKRFDVLFEAKEKWTLKEITPYLTDLCLDGQTVYSILSKYSRSSITGGEKVFSTRKCFK